MCAQPDTSVRNRLMTTRQAPRDTPRDLLVAELARVAEHVTRCEQIAADIDDRRLDETIGRLRTAAQAAGIRAVHIPAF